MSTSALGTDHGVFYVAALSALREAEVPFLVGGAYALERYTGIARDTKDLDVFVRPRDAEVTLKALAAAGFPTELTFPHWLGKAFGGDAVLDIIFSSGNGCARVDDGWFQYAVPAVVLGLPAQLCPPEEMIWSKAFIMERERYDGADVAHLLRARGPSLDWPRLIRRFGHHWRVLLCHLLLFGFVYPTERTNVPSWVTQELIERLQQEAAEQTDAERLCRGTLLSRSQYLVDIESWGYRDARLGPGGPMTEDDIRVWTDAGRSSR
jgi:hypothetical protein